MTKTARQPRQPTAGPGSRLPVVVLGNPLRADDGAALQIGRRLQQRPDCRCQSCAQPSSLVESWRLFAKAEAVLVLDGVFSGSPPGTLHLAPLPCDAVGRRALGTLSSHGLGVVESLELARALWNIIPRVLLLGIEIGSLSHVGPRSPAVEQAIELVVERFSRLRAVLLNGRAGCWKRHRGFLPGDMSFPGE